MEGCIVSFPIALRFLRIFYFFLTNHVVFVHFRRGRLLAVKLQKRNAETFRITCRAETLNGHEKKLRIVPAFETGRRVASLRIYRATFPQIERCQQISFCPSGLRLSELDLPRSLGNANNIWLSINMRYCSLVSARGLVRLIQYHNHRVIPLRRSTSPLTA